jgi:hypothetical protein
MPLTPDQVTELETKQSSYGCGADDCSDCYPIQYSCEWCKAMFPEPIGNGEEHICPNCGYIANSKTDDLFAVGDYWTLSCTDFAPDSLAPDEEDRNVCTTCLWHKNDHEGED